MRFYLVSVPITIKKIYNIQFKRLAYSFYHIIYCISRINFYHKLLVINFILNALKLHMGKSVVWTRVRSTWRNRRMVFAGIGVHQISAAGTPIQRISELRAVSMSDGKTSRWALVILSRESWPRVFGYFWRSKVTRRRQKIEYNTLILIVLF